MITLLEVLQKSATFLGSKQVEHARLNAELLVGHALGLKRMQLYLEFERLLPEADLEKIRPLIRRRSQREPLQYIIGSVEFGGVELKVDKRALIPRPETEYLVELLKEEFAAVGKEPGTVIDLGTGSGALALALAQMWSAAKVYATDVSEEALALTTENCEALELGGRVTVLQSDWFASVPADERFDLIVANPPYLTANEVEETSPEVKQFEPAMALSTAKDGMDAITTIITAAGSFLNAGGLLAMETGIAQHPQAFKLLAAVGYAHIISRPDLTGRDRFIFARKN